MAAGFIAMPACDVEEDDGFERSAEDITIVDEADDEEEIDQEGVQDVDAPDSDQPGDFAPRPDTQADADSSTRLNLCEWRRESTSTDRFLYVECLSYQKPISGGCDNNNQNATIQSSMPFEHGSQNWPETGENWYDTDGTTGWRCKKDGDAGTLTGTALCCGLQPPS